MLLQDSYVHEPGFTEGADPVNEDDGRIAGADVPVANPGTGNTGVEIRGKRGFPFGSCSEIPGL
jgi:hypothetical protein